QVTLATSDTTCTLRSPAWTDSTTSPPTFHEAVCWSAIGAGPTELVNWAAAFGPTGGQILVSVSKVRHIPTSISELSPCPGLNLGGDECRSATFLDSSESPEESAMRQLGKSHRINPHHQAPR